MRAIAKAQLTNTHVQKNFIRVQQHMLKIPKQIALYIKHFARYI